jgi:hypothetical protein
MPTCLPACMPAPQINKIPASGIPLKIKTLTKSTKLAYREKAFNPGCQFNKKCQYFSDYTAENVF